MLTHARLLEVLRYNRRTGVFVWRLRLAQRIQVGDIAGCKDDIYGRIRIDGRLYYAHRLAWFYVTGAWPRHRIDHKTSPSNRFTNLRDVTTRTNNENQRRAPKHSKTGLIGAHLLPDGRYKSQIKVAGKNKHLGYFKTEVSAHRAYLKAKRELHAGCTL